MHAANSSSFLTRNFSSKDRKVRGVQEKIKIMLSDWKEVIATFYNAPRVFFLAVYLHDEIIILCHPTNYATSVSTILIPFFTTLNFTAYKLKHERLHN